MTKVDSGFLTEISSPIVGYVTGLDATAVAITELFVTEPGKKLIVEKVVVIVSSFTSGGKAVDAIASFGGNAATYDDFLNSQTYTFTAVDMYLPRGQSDTDTEKPVYAAGASFRCSIETASDATIEEWDIYVYGTYIPE